MSERTEGPDRELRPEAYDAAVRRAEQSPWVSAKDVRAIVDAALATQHRLDNDALRLALSGTTKEGQL